MKKILLLVNPASGTNNNLKIAKQVCEYLKDTWQIEEHISQYKGFFVDFLQNFDFKNIHFDCIGVLGGDGTMHEVVNGVLQNENFNDVPILLFPCGTGNAFNYDLNCLNIETACENLKNGKTKQIDILSLKTEAKQSYAFNIVGCGLVSDINKRSESMRWLGSLRYTVTALIDILRNPRFAGTVQVDDQTFSGNFSFVLVSNTIHTGKAMKMSPLAKIDDGLLDVIVVKHLPFWQLLRLFPLIFSGKHINSNLLTYIHAKKIKIEAAPTDLNIDGEVSLRTPIEVNVLENRLRIICSF